MPYPMNEHSFSQFEADDERPIETCPHCGHVGETDDGECYGCGQWVSEPAPTNGRRSEDG